MPAPLQNTRLTAGRFLHALYVAKSTMNAIAYCEGQPWLDRDHLIAGFRAKAAVDPVTSSDYGGFQAVTESFVGAMRTFSVPARLEGLRRVPLLTKVFAGANGITAAQISEGGGIPVLKGTWATQTLEPKKFAGIAVQTGELLRATTPAAALAITGDLAEAVAEAENEGFVSPWATGSVLNGGFGFASSGSTAAAIAADLGRLIDYVPRCHRGGAWVMHPLTAGHLGSRRDGGGAAFPNVGPMGGEIMGLPVLTTEAMEQAGSPTVRAIGLLSPTEIFYADGEVVDLEVTEQAALQMDDAATADPANMVGLFQADAAATKAVMRSSWYARSGAGAYFTTSF